MCYISKLSLQISTRSLGTAVTPFGFDPKDRRFDPGRDLYFCYCIFRSAHLVALTLLAERVLIRYTMGGHQGHTCHFTPAVFTPKDKMHMLP